MKPFLYYARRVNYYSNSIHNTNIILKFFIMIIGSLINKKKFRKLLLYFGICASLFDFILQDK